MNLQQIHQFVLQHAPMGYALHRILCNDSGIPVDYEFIDVNQAFRELTGALDRDIVGKRVSEVFPGILQDTFDWVAYYGEIALGGVPSRTERYSEACGRWYQVDAFSPESEFFVVLFTDISAHVQKNLALQASENRYRALIDTAPICVLVANIETQEITYANPMMLEIFGYSSSELVGMRVLDFHPVEHHAMALQEFGAVIMGLQRQTADLPCLRKDGSRFLASIAAIKTEIDGIPSVVGFIRDVTERRKTEDALKAERDLFIGGPIVVFIWNHREGWPLGFVSENAVQVLGYAPEFFLEKPHRYLELMHPEDRGRIVREVESALTGNALYYEQEYRLLCSDGEYHWLYDFTVPRRNEAGMVTDFHGYVMDITESRRNRESLKRQLAAEKLIAEVSTSLIDVSARSIDFKIEKALQQLGTFFGVDRAYIFQFSEDLSTMNNTYEWCAKGVEAQRDILQAIPVAAFPWWEHQMRQMGVISIEDVSLMPPEAAMEQKFLTNYGATSVLCMSMMRNDRVTGFIGLDSVKEMRVWANDVIGLLGILGNIISDTFNRYQSDKEILYLSYHDKLTGLYNRRYFEEELHRMDTESLLPLSVIIGDVNGLKITNDVFGHRSGDDLLRRVGEILKASCREIDVVARWGGDEFVILLPQTSPAAAGVISKRIYDYCQGATGLPVHVSISLGHATKNNMSQSMEHVLNAAEDWMYRRKLLESRSFRSAMINSLISTLSEKSYEAVGHTERMGNMSLRIGKAMGLTEEEMETLSLLAMLHDIGKVAIPEHILTKRGPLTDAEWIEIKRHPEIGFRITQSTSELSQLSELILGHHERWDGLGYPHNLKGDEIPKLSRVVAVIDAYDVMTHECPYKNIRTHKEAMAEIKRCSGTQFDPEIVDLFLKVSEENVGI